MNEHRRVFVLDDQNKVTVVAAAKPTEVEANMKNITSLLSDISGLDVRVRKIEPHYEKDAQNSLITNLHLYAIDTMTNSVVENEVFGRLLKEKELEIKSEMEPYHFLGISSTTSSDNEIRLQRSEKTILSGLETMTVMLGCIIFLGALTAATCVACFNRKRSKYENGTTSLFPAIDPADLPFSLYTGSKSMNDLSACRPRSLFNPLSFVEDSNVNTLNNNIAYRRQRRPSHHHNSCMQGHSDKCVAQSLIRSRSAGGLLGASVASLHSSERDSGIEAAHNHRRSTKCQCKHSVFFSSSANSSNGSYEDSLKSLQAQHSAGSDSEPFNGRTNQKIQSNFSRLHKELSAKQAARIRQSLSRLNI